MQLGYLSDSGFADQGLVEKHHKGQSFMPVYIRKLDPIQMPSLDIDEVKRGRGAFTKEEWMDVLLRSIGMEPDTLSVREIIPTPYTLIRY